MHCEFTATILTLCETCDGFITYTIALSTYCEPRKHFQVERCFSEFAALAAALRTDNNKPSSDMCRQSDGETDGEDEQDEEADNNDNDRHSSSNGAVFQWELPPKTWFKLTHPPVLEDRRLQQRARESRDADYAHTHEEIILENGVAMLHGAGLLPSRLEEHGEDVKIMMMMMRGHGECCLQRSFIFSFINAFTMKAEYSKLRLNGTDALSHEAKH